VAPQVGSAVFIGEVVLGHFAPVVPPATNRIIGSSSRRIVSRLTLKQGNLFFFI